MAIVGKDDHMNQRTCAYPECGREHESNNYCHGHMAQLRRGRDLKPLRAVSPRGSSLADRLVSRTNKTATCWLWTGALSPNGYGRVGGGSATRSAHRVAYELEFGAIPAGYDIDHICFVRHCVNPSHLRAVTRKQNMEHLSGALDRSQTGIRGVYWWPERRKYVAALVHNQKKVHVGYFDTIQEADAAVRAKRAELFTHDDAEY